MFHSLDGLTTQEQQQANVREFVGDGTPYLKCPGLKDQPTLVRLGANILPMTIVQEFPTEIPGRLQTVESPLWIMQVRSDGMPILLRSQQSNDGVWQAGVSVFVQGEWQDDAPKPAVKPAPDVQGEWQDDAPKPAVKPAPDVQGVEVPAAVEPPKK